MSCRTDAMQRHESADSFSARLNLVVPSERQPNLRDLLFATGCPNDDVTSLFTLPDIRASRKTIIVLGDLQFFQNDHGGVVLEGVLALTPTEYVAEVEALTLFHCGFVMHELYNDGHVCKHSDRENYLDCAHSISRKVLETAMALVRNDGGNDFATEFWETALASFVSADHGLAELDRALAEVAGGPLRQDSMEIFVRETGFCPEYTTSGHADPVKLREAVGSILQERQAYYADPLLSLAHQIAPRLYLVLKARLTLWSERQGPVDETVRG